MAESFTIGLPSVRIECKNEFEICYRKGCPLKDYLETDESGKNYCDNIICFYSDNDPYVKFDVEKEFADTISNKQHIIKNGGHINAESGYTKFEEILKEI